MSVSNSVDCWVACGSIGPEKAEEVAVSVDVVEQVQDVAVSVSEEERLVLVVGSSSRDAGRQAVQKCVQVGNEKW